VQGLVLSGGGAKGAYQVGVVKALEEIGYAYDCITGTSIGAINGAFIASGQIELLYELWSELKLSDIIAGDTELLHKLIALDVKAQDFHQIIRSFKGIVEGSGLNITPFKTLIRKHLSEERIRSSKMELGMVTVSLTDFKPVELFKADIPQGLMLDYLIASANLPVFNIERLEGKFFIDGGFYDNLPINLMASKGVVDMVAVDLGAIGMTRRPENQELNIRTICPSEDVGRLLEITPKKAKRNLNLGYYDTLKTFKKFQGNHYFIWPEQIKGKTEAYLWQNEIDISALENHFLIKGMDQKRALFEKVLPFFTELLKLDPQMDYFGLCVGIMEAMAESLKIERLTIYSYRELAQLIEDKQKYRLIQPSLIPIYTKGWTSALMTKKQKETLLQMGWEIVKGAFLHEGL
jgi:NTE family protein